MTPWNRRFLLETIIFRFHVKLGEGRFAMFQQVGPAPKLSIVNMDIEVMGWFKTQMRDIEVSTWTTSPIYLLATICIRWWWSHPFLKKTELNFISSPRYQCKKQ